MPAQNKKNSSKKGTKYGMDLQDLKNMKRELESKEGRDFEDEFLEGEEYLQGQVDACEEEDMSPKQISKKRKFFKILVASVSAAAMIIGGITVGVILGSGMSNKKGGESND